LKFVKIVCLAVFPASVVAIALGQSWAIYPAMLSQVILVVSVISGLLYDQEATGSDSGKRSVTLPGTYSMFNIDDFIASIPEPLMGRSGSVFYSGRDAFSKPSDLYVMGFNPGGDPSTQDCETIRWHTDKVMNHEDSNWSTYRDESWRNSTPGTWGMQPRVLQEVVKQSF